MHSIRLDENSNYMLPVGADWRSFCKVREHFSPEHWASSRTQHNVDQERCDKALFQYRTEERRKRESSIDGLDMNLGRQLQTLSTEVILQRWCCSWCIMTDVCNITESGTFTNHVCCCYFFWTMWCADMYVVFKFSTQYLSGCSSVAVPPSGETIVSVEGQSE